MDVLSYRDRTYLELIKQAQKQAPIAIVASSLNASILVAVLWHTISHPVLIVWLCATLCLASARSVFLHKHPADSLRSDEAPFAAKWLVIGLSLSGIMWGFAGVFLFPLDSPAHQALIVFVLCGMVSGATSAFSSFIPAFLAFTIPALIPLLIRFLVVGGSIYYGMSAMTVLYFVLMWIIARRMNVTKRELLELKDHFAKTAQALEESNKQLHGEIVERKRVEETLRNSEAQLRFLSSRRLSAQEEERKRIAHELHDSIGGVLSSIKFGLENSIGKMREGRLTPQDLDTLVATTQYAMEEARRIYMDLRPSVLDDLGLIATIGWFTRQFNSHHPKIHIEDSIELSEDGIPEHLKIVLFRVMQEAFHNIAKHSQATLVEISLVREESRMTLTVSDNGEGFAPVDVPACRTGGTGLGLGSMRERVESSGGALLIRSSRGMGTTIQAMWDLGCPAILSMASPDIS